MNVLDLFSGIGGFSLGLERAGMRTVQFCEIDPFCRRVLAKHWPNVPCHDDVRTLSGVAADVICGGFPCQDISVAGAGAGLSGERSGLWTHFSRLIGEVRPRFAIVENVSALLHRGLEAVLGDLAAIGYDAEWHCIPAATVGAPHRRDRIWIVAYPSRSGHGVVLQPLIELWRSLQADTGSDGEARTMADSDGAERRPQREACDTDRAQLLLKGQESSIGLGDCGAALGDPDHQGELQPQGCIRDIWRRPSDSSWWAVEPDVGRMAHGVSQRVDRLRALGNSVVPQIPEIIGRAIMTYLSDQTDC